MKKLTRRYFRLPEAAQMLRVSPDDLIHFAAHGDIDLHVLLPSSVYVNPICVATDDIFGDPLKENYVIGIPAMEPAKLSADEWRRFEADPTGASISSLSAENFSDLEFQRTPEGITLGWWQIVDSDWKPTTLRIADCVVVMTESSIIKANQEKISSKVELSTTERNSLLTIIAALCDYSALDHQQRGVANRISELTQAIGAAVSDDTVRRWLKLIPEALESRQK